MSRHQQDKSNDTVSHVDSACVTRSQTNKTSLAHPNKMSRAHLQTLLNLPTTEQEARYSLHHCHQSASRRPTPGASPVTNRTPSYCTPASRDPPATDNNNRGTWPKSPNTLQRVFPGGHGPHMPLPLIDIIESKAPDSFHTGSLRCAGGARACPAARAPYMLHRVDRTVVSAQVCTGPSMNCSLLGATGYISKTESLQR
jgi:hypothetical protein